MPPIPTWEEIVHPSDWRELVETGVRVIAEFATRLPLEAFEAE